MKALTYHGAKDVRVDECPDPRIEVDDDVVIRVTATAVCGSDLHIYRGKMPAMEKGDILGHEFMGIIDEVGSSVTAVKRGDRVIVPFNIFCGQCFFCSRELYAACETTNVQTGTLKGRGAIVNKKGIKPGAALFGYTHLYGGVAGGQAERVRIPKGNAVPFKVPSNLDDEKVLFLTDILPTGYMAVDNAAIEAGSTVAIYGAGPVGLMAAASARQRRAGRIFMVDHHPYRLEFAADKYGAEPLDFDKVDDPAEEIIRRTDRRGADAVIDAVGFEAKGSVPETVMANLKLEGGSGFVLRQAIAATRRGGVVSVPGVYAAFLHGFLFGDAFDKGLTFKMGQTHVKKYLELLLGLIQSGELKPEEIITHRLPLSKAADGYTIFNEKKEDCRKVVLRPD